MSEPAGGAAGVHARFQAALAEHRAGRSEEAVRSLGDQMDIALTAHFPDIALSDKGQGG